MLKKLVALGALTTALIGVPAASASADPGYAPSQLPTETVIEVEVGAAGEPSILYVSATANYATPPEGDIAVKLTAASGSARSARAVAAAPILSTTVHFVDEPIAIETPNLPEGRYLATAAFTPDDSDFFANSSNALRFGVAEAGSAGGEEDGGSGSGSGLPNTGGPNLMWLLLGGGLVAAGAGGVTYGRRREDATA